MRSTPILAAMALVLLIASCAAPQKTIYFSDNVPLDPHVQVENIEKRKEISILPGDILAINVTSISSITAGAGGTGDPVVIFNEGGTTYNISSSMGSAGSGGGSNKAFLVDENGFIDYPVLGKVKVSGLTLREIKDQLGKRLVDFILEPVVEIRIINYKITVLGEVGHPGSIIASNHKISVIDAIALAGDIPITGRKDNVMIVRETEGRREYARLNLNSRNVFSSPYFYLKQNDLIYVEPARIRRQESNEFLRFYLPTFTSLLSAAIAIYGVTQIVK
ncbi:MAG: polysaccharide biosynthesis/export family protein [Chitinophagaceae bacterium]|nr:polysaccharide biosynthesis/export family protein [Chitinophagaceae bacterium]MCB9045604.1 polysaccharide biosynthesis/export family protein [Chitinophagales bacterium]